MGKMLALSTGSLSFMQGRGVGGHLRQARNSS